MLRSNWPDNTAARVEQVEDGELGRRIGLLRRTQCVVSSSCRVLAVMLVFHFGTCHGKHWIQSGIFPPKKHIEARSTITASGKRIPEVVSRITEMKEVPRGPPGTGPDQ